MRAFLFRFQEGRRESGLHVNWKALWPHDQFASSVMEWNGMVGHPTEREDTYMKTNRLNDTCLAFNCILWYNELLCYIVSTHCAHRDTQDERHIAYHPPSAPSSHKPSWNSTRETHFPCLTIHPRRILAWSYTSHPPFFLVLFWSLEVESPPAFQVAI